MKQTSHPLVRRFYGFCLVFVFYFEQSKEKKSEKGSNICSTIYFFWFDLTCLVTVLTVLLFHSSYVVNKKNKCGAVFICSIRP